MQRLLVRKNLLSRAVFLAFVGAGLCGCEEETQSLPPSEPPPPAHATPTEPTAVSAAAHSGAVSDLEKNEAKETESVDEARRLPFLRNKTRPTKPNPIFQGDPIETSKAYRNRRVRSSGVSPIERHWGNPSKATAAAPKDIAAILDAEEPTDNGSAKAQAKAGEYRLVMYRLNAKTGSVETFDHGYHSNRSREAALARKTSKGYRLTRPGEEDVKDRNQKPGAAGDANKKGKSGAKKSGDDCPVRVSWTTGDGSSRAEQSRCFKTREEARRFQQEKRKAAGLTGNGPGARRRPKREAPKTKAPSRENNSLQPQTK